jgi:hypothetical protein
MKQVVFIAFFKYVPLKAVSNLQLLSCYLSDIRSIYNGQQTGVMPKRNTTYITSVVLL